MIGQFPIQKDKLIGESKASENQVAYHELLGIPIVRSLVARLCGVVNERGGTWFRNARVCAEQITTLPKRHAEGELPLDAT